MKSIVSIMIVFAGLLILGNCVSKKEEKQEYQYSDQLGTPEEELAGFTIKEGFTIELVASERDGIIKPIDLTFDDAGRLWTQTAMMYPLDPVADAQWNDLLRLMDDVEAQKKYPSFKRILDLYQGKTKGTDKVLIISGLYDDNPVAVNVWADSLAIPMSILPYKDGAYIAQGSEMFFLRDSNRDGKADERIPMFTGFGFVDTHTLAHALVRGPGDWIYFSHGALNKGEVRSLHSDAKQRINYSKIARFSLDAKKLELVTAGLNNIWGFQLRNNGQWYATEANDLGFSVLPMEPGTALRGIGNERIRDYQPWMPELHKFRVGGTGISGLAFADDKEGSFSDEWKNVAFLANPITSTINAVKIERNADGSVSATHLTDLLTSKDKHFRPVNMEFGPDGCLYVADWYNKIISHNEISRDDPERDKSHGRIWRIRQTNQKHKTIPDFNNVKTEALVDYLKSPSLWMKRSAWHQITDRPLNETRQMATQLVALAGDKMQDEDTRIHALWSLEGIKHFDSSLMSTLLESKEDNLCREAIRSLASFSVEQSKMASAFNKLIDHPNPMIRSQVLRTISEVGLADTSTIRTLVYACKPELPGNEMGGLYERKFERYLALKALEQYPEQLIKFIDSRVLSGIPPTNYMWAVQALPKELGEKYFLSFWRSAGIKELDESTFIQICKMLDNENIYLSVKEIFQNPAQTVKNIDFALKNQQQVQSVRLSSLLEEPVSSLLKSNIIEEKKMALDAIGRLKMNAPVNDILSLINDETPSGLLKLVLAVLENNSKLYQQEFVRVFQNEKFDFDIRSSALNSILKTDQKAGLSKLENWIPQLNSERKKSLVNSLSNSNQGAAVILKLFTKGVIKLDEISHGTAERIYNTHLNDGDAKSLVTQARERADKDRRTFNNKKEKYLTILEKQDGNSQKGKIIFEGTCLSCHKVGQKGHDIAPALDGSSSRSNDALVTAILNPDAAFESDTGCTELLKKTTALPKVICIIRMIVVLRWHSWEATRYLLKAAVLRRTVLFRAVRLCQKDYWSYTPMTRWRICSLISGH